jgi:hypothetical protein
MAVIHRTTLAPTKLELLTAWLPSQPWYRGGEDGPELTRAGGWRLDDPADEVGIELMAVNDLSGSEPVTYHVPLTYRGSPLDGGDDGLVGTTEHGVLGRRWVYDGVHDPVLVAQVLALVNGVVGAQQQSQSHTPDPTVVAVTHRGGPFAVAAPLAVETGTTGTDIQGFVSDAGPAVLHVARQLRPGRGPDALADVEAGWMAADGATARAAWLVLAGG